MSKTVYHVPCNHFEPQKWRQNICATCFHKEDEHGSEQSKEQNSLLVQKDLTPKEVPSSPQKEHKVENKEKKKILKYLKKNQK